MLAFYLPSDSVSSEVISQPSFRNQSPSNVASQRESGNLLMTTCQSVTCRGGRLCLSRCLFSTSLVAGWTLLFDDGKGLYHIECLTTF